MDPRQILTDFKKDHDFFIGIDSDGCVFDTMEIKHKECFCPSFIKYFNLQSVQKYAREAWEFVNLYSINRGCNRFNAVVYALEILAERKEFKARNGKTVDTLELKEWLKIETKLGNPSLEKYVTDHPTVFMQNLLAWSKAVNKSIEDMVYGIPPFPLVNKCLEKMKAKADLMVVSQTPLEALKREWEENKIDHYVKIIAGQELGTKTEHLKYGAVGKYEQDKILMIGDAMGDYKAAKSNGVQFFPVNPGHEEESWERFQNEALDKFFNGTYKGKYEEELMKEFDSLLPERPKWK
jgi:phosphoglycolate phosphatase-like HAD superfamily hydrolase